MLNSNLESYINSDDVARLEVQEIADYDELYDNIQIILNYSIHVQAISTLKDEKISYYLMISFFAENSLFIEDKELDFTQDHVTKLYLVNEYDEVLHILRDLQEISILDNFETNVKKEVLDYAVMRTFIANDHSEITYAFYDDFSAKEALLTYTFNNETFDLEINDNSVELYKVLDSMHCLEHIATINTDLEDRDKIEAMNQTNFKNDMRYIETVDDDDFQALENTFQSVAFEIFA